MKKKKTGKEVVQKRREICDFARDNNLVIHPGGYGYYIDSFLMFHYCSCAPERKNCPCPEAIEEVAKNGHCRCNLFWRSLDDFKKEMLN